METRCQYCKAPLPEGVVIPHKDDSNYLFWVCEECSIKRGLKQPAGEAK